MDELRFRIVGMSNQQVRSWRKPAQPNPQHSPLRVRLTRAWRSATQVTRIFVVVATLAACDYVLFAQPSVSDIVGRRVLVLLDTSASMGNTTERTNQQLAVLGTRNISVTEPYSMGGFAISSGNPTYSLLEPLQRAIAANPLADTIYVISDFKGGDEEDNDVAGYQQLGGLLRERHLTLYLCTVDHLPPPQYYDIASASGGGVIEEYKNPQQER